MTGDIVRDLFNDRLEVENVFYKVMTRVLLSPNDVLTPFELRGQIFRVNVELSTYYREQKKISKKCPKIFFDNSAEI